MLNLKQEPRHSAHWRFNTALFKNKLLKKEVLNEIKDVSSATNQNIHKIYIKSIIKAFKKPKAPEDKIKRLNKKISQIKEAIAKNPNQVYLHIVLDILDSQIQTELTELANRQQ